MDIRTKLVLAFVTVALTSMFLLGVFALDSTTAIVTQISARQLDALAESKRRDLEKVVEGWRDRVRLISSRTQLRRSLKAYQARSSSEELVRMTRILADALSAVSDLKRLSLFDEDGTLVVSVGESRAALAEGLTPAGVELVGVFPYESDVEVLFQVELDLDGERIGALEVVHGADEVEDVTGDYTGLEESGEAFVVVRSADGSVSCLNQLRHGARASLCRFSDGQISPDIEAALDGDERVFSGGIRDYRGELVWAATRQVADTGWGLVVKVDAAEEHEKTTVLRDVMTDLALSLSAFAILGGTLAGFVLARPIRQLAEVVGRIRGGESELRADQSPHDEVGFLGRALNELMDELHGRGSPPPSSRD